MPSKHLNLSTIVDKNKIASENAFLVLIEAAIKDSEGELVETIRIVKNSENITYKGNVYTAANFRLDVKMEANQEASVSLKAEDQTRALAQYIDLYDGLVDSKVKMIIVNSGALDAEPELEEEFIVTGSSVSDYVADIKLGVESAVSHRFPNYRQFKDRCVWKFKGPRCKYAGPDSTCSYTRHGVNGCIAKNNEINFGGFPGINELM